MRCPFCLERESRVIDSREVSDGLSIRRRRECLNCHRRFTTYERYQQAAMMVIKKDGRREEFDPTKLRQKLRVALTKRPVGEKEVDALIQRVEGKLLALGLEEDLQGPWAGGAARRTGNCRPLRPQDRGREGR